MSKTLAVMFLAVGLVNAKEAHLPVFGSGGAQDVNRATAVERAAAEARLKINQDCDGAVTAIKPTAEDCFGGGAGSPYHCIVTVRAACQRTLHKTGRRF